MIPSALYAEALLDYCKTYGGHVARVSMTSLDWLDQELAALEQRQLRRRLPRPLSRLSPVVDLDGQQTLNFASNDYLGLAGDQRLARAALDACRTEGVGRGSSPLICGRSEWHDRLERRLAEFERCEAALLFPSGYAANIGVIPALVGKGDAVFSDAKNHASIVDGCRLSRACVHIYPHGDCEALERRLRDAAACRRRLIVTDSVFSMDGDIAPLPELTQLAEQYDAMLMVDEAHATGVFGENGRGIVEYFDNAAATHAHDLHARIDVRIGTLSKALGASGGFACGSTQLVDWLANRARSYVFSTAQPSAASAAAFTALDVVGAEPERRNGLLETSRLVRKELTSRGWNCGNSDSQIIPIVVGSAERVLRLAAELRQRRIWIPAIRPPSVPEGESLLRLSLTAAHSPEAIDRLLESLAAAEVARVRL